MPKYIVSLGVGTRARGFLRSIPTIEEAEAITMDELSRASNVGREAVRQIWNALHPFDPVEPHEVSRIGRRKTADYRGLLKRHLAGTLSITDQNTIRELKAEIEAEKRARDAPRPSWRY